MKRTIKGLIQYIFRVRHHYFWQDRIILVSFLGSIFLNLVLWVFLCYHLGSVEDITPLHYNIYFGVDLIGEKIQLLKIPLLGLIIFLVNLILSFRLYKHERINSYFLIISSVIVQIVLLLAGYLILSL